MATPNLYGGPEHYHIGRVHKHRRWIIIAGVCVVAILFFVGYLIVFKKQASAPVSEEPVPVQATNPETSQPLPLEPTFDDAAIQAAVTKWVQQNKGTYSVSITTTKGDTLAEYRPDTQYFAASIYKLYVAYEGYRRIDDGTYTLNQPYLGSFNRGQCLDKMIRESHSPCAEKMWVELGKETINNSLKSYGLTNTSMTGIYTSAADAAIILGRVERGDGLSKQSQAAFLESMKKQIYRDGLPAGFTKATVYDKVGFKEKVEYHDVAIVKLEQGTLIVSVMTKNAGTKNIAGLASAIQSAATR